LHRDGAGVVKLGGVSELRHIDDDVSHEHPVSPAHTVDDVSM
jgi:hypothetical protein